MYHLIIRIEKDGKEIFESEREIDVQYSTDGDELHISVVPPRDTSERVYDALNEAEDYLNINPELWLHDVPVNDDDTDPQGDK